MGNLDQRKQKQLVRFPYDSRRHAAWEPLSWAVTGTRWAVSPRPPWCSVAPSQVPASASSFEGEIPETQEWDSGGCAQGWHVWAGSRVPGGAHVHTQVLCQALLAEVLGGGLPQWPLWKSGLDSGHHPPWHSQYPQQWQAPHQVTRQTNDQTRIPTQFQPDSRAKGIWTVSKPSGIHFPNCWASPAHGQMVMPPGTAVSLSCQKIHHSLALYNNFSKDMKCFQ